MDRVLLALGTLVCAASSGIVAPYSADPYNGTSSINCTLAECDADLRICHKISDSCTQWWDCITSDCGGSRRTNSHTSLLIHSRILAFQVR